MVLGYFGHNFGVWFRFGIAFEQRFGPDLVYNNSLNLVFLISIWSMVVLDTDLVSGFDLLRGVFIDNVGCVGTRETETQTCSRKQSLDGYRVRRGVQVE